MIKLVKFGWHGRYGSFGSMVEVTKNVESLLKAMEKGFDVELFDALATPKSKQIKYPEKFSFLLPFYGEKDMSAFSLFHEFRHYGYSFEHIGAVIMRRRILEYLRPVCRRAGSHAMRQY